MYVCVCKCVHLCMCLFVGCQPMYGACERVCLCALQAAPPHCAVHENTSHIQQGPAHGKINMLVIEIC